MIRRSIVLGVLALGFALFATAVWYTTRSTPATESAEVPTELQLALIRPYSPILGPEEAPVTIVEFFDPACEACRAFYPIVEDIMAEHGESVRVVLRYTPFHGEGSEIAIRVLEAARMQGNFEAVLEALMEEQPRWAAHGDMRPDLILQVAVSAGLDPEAAQAQMLAPQTTGLLNQERTDIETVGVRQTPTFFVNGRPVDPFGEAELRALVAEEVASES
ncbi:MULTISPECIES: DsbA family protein [Nioella]|jgi:protein-disulfide isomerase|uniref:DsbA family protein n=1 Tax=Nioella TaxID=1775424 RepID=UPI000FD85F81|nr:thioredoxin domain-containing protein [Nioella ostreopsis]